MSRGPGRIERAIRALLSDHPDGAFITDEIIGTCFPNESVILKKHRVSALRAFRKVGYSLGWHSEMIGGQRGEFVIYNPLSLYSYAIGRTRAHEHGGWSKEDSRAQIISAEKAEAMLLGRDARDRSIWVRSGGPYPIAVERNIALKDGDTSRAEALWEDFKTAARTAVYLPDRIGGEIHPDFLARVKGRA